MKCKTCKKNIHFVEKFILKGLCIYCSDARDRVAKKKEAEEDKLYEEGYEELVKKRLKYFEG